MIDFLWIDVFSHECRCNPHGPTVEQQPPINLEDGMEVEIAGKKYIYADDYLSMGKGSGIPKVMLKQMIRNGEAKIVG